MRSWLRPATAIGSNWIDPNLPNTSSTPSRPPPTDLAGERKCRPKRKRRAASAVTFTETTLAAHIQAHLRPMRRTHDSRRRHLGSGLFGTGPPGSALTRDAEPHGQ